MAFTLTISNNSYYDFKKCKTLILIYTIMNFMICQIKKKHFNPKDIFYIQNLIMDIKLLLY